MWSDGRTTRKKYNVPDQRVIGKRSENELGKMVLNENYVKHFGILDSLKKRRMHTGAVASG